jgi:hypothetical protein
MPSEELVPSLLAASDVLGTGWFAADAANVKPGSTVVVVGDGAVGLLGVLSARQMGADRIIAMSRHDNSICPGWVRTDIGGPTATRSVEEGADTAVWLADKAKHELTGKFAIGRRFDGRPICERHPLCRMTGTVLSPLRS